MVNDHRVSLSNLFILDNRMSIENHFYQLMQPSHQILMDFRAFVRTQLFLLCIKVTLEIDSSSFIRSLFCLRSSIFPIIEYKIDLLRTKMCNDAFYFNNYPVAITNQYKLGVITASTQVYSRNAGNVTISQVITTNQVTQVTQQGNQGQGFQTTSLNTNTQRNQNQGGNFQTTPQNNNNRGNQGQGGNFQTTPFNNQQGNTQRGNFQTTTIRGPFMLSSTVPSTQLTTIARVTPEFNPSEDTFNDYDEVESYAAPRQKTGTTELTTERDIEPLEFAAELLPAEKIIEETHINCGKTRNVTKTENVTTSKV